MAGYVYNPGESIKQDFQQAGSAVGNIFAQVIQQQQRDYSLAENAFSNIEALKKDLNIYGQKSITGKANNLLGYASSAILQNGKLDYSKMGEIRQAVSDIKDLKAGYDLGAKEYERMLQVGLANKDNLTSFEGFYKDLSAKMSDENLVKNPRDLQAALADTYTKSLDATKMFGKSYLASNPYQKVAYDIKDPKTGAMMRVQGELPAGWSIDAAGNRIPPKTVTVTNVDGTTSTVDYADQTLAQLKATNPDTLAAMRRQAGFAGQNMSDKQLVEYYTTKIPMTSQTQQVASADELKAKAAQAEKLTFEASKMGEMYDLDRQLKLSAIAENNAQRQKALSEIQKGITNISDLSVYGINKNSQGKSVDFGAEVEIRVADPANPKKTIPFKATGLRTLSNGRQELVGFSTTGAIDEKTKQIIYGQQVAYYPYSKSAATSLPMAVKNLGKDKEANISQSIAIYNTIPVVQSKTQPPKGKTPIKAATQFKGEITKSKLSSMYGQGKEYADEESAAQAAIDLGYKVEGYN
jgi:hypothetical protein